MWWFLKLLVLGPPSRAVEAPLRRRMNDLEADIEQLQTDRESKRGQILTLQRRIRRLELELWDEEDVEEEGDEVDALIRESRKSH